MPTPVESLWETSVPEKSKSTGDLWSQAAPADKSVIITPPDQKPGFLSGFQEQFSPKNVAIAAGATLAPVPALAAGFGSQDSKSFQSPEQRAELEKKFKAAHDQTADAIKEGNYLKAARIGQDLLLGEGLKEPVDAIEDQISKGEYTHALGSTLGFLSQFAVGHGIGKAADFASPWIKGSLGDLNKADPAKDYISVYGSGNPKVPEIIPRALADIKEHSPASIRSNEQLASLSPSEVLREGALKANRDAMETWHRPVQEAGFSANPRNILQATMDSVKAMADPERRGHILQEAQHQLAQEPLTPDRLKTLLEEKNGELAGFYSRDPAVQEAAKQAGALTGRSQALLEAQANAIRDEYYKLLDPQGEGAGPREIQSRYGAIKEVQKDATDRRNSILAETSGTPLSRTAKSALALLDIPGAPFREGLQHGFKAVYEPFTGESDPIVTRMFRNAPEYTKLPEAPPLAQRYPTADTGGARQLPPSPYQMPPKPDESGVIITPAMTQPPNPARALPPASTRFHGPVPDKSEVRAADAMTQPPRTDRALPPANTRFQGTVSPDSGVPSAVTHTLPTLPDGTELTIVNAAKGVARNPKTGRFYRYFTSGKAPEEMPTVSLRNIVEGGEK